MTTLRTFAFIFALLTTSSLLSATSLQKSTDLLQGNCDRPTLTVTAEDSVVKNATDSVPNKKKRVTYASKEEAAKALEKAKELPTFAGVSVGFDVCGAAMAVLGSWGQYEAVARANLKGRYFPTVECGIGYSHHEDETTEIRYSVNAPYFRLGMDYNLANDVASGNRILLGARYGFSSFQYDLDGPDLIDPVYGTATPFHFSGLKGCNHWLELCAGLEAKVVGTFHIGWSIRYKFRISNKPSAVGSPWYVPGFGKNDGHALGGSLHILIDI